MIAAKEETLSSFPWCAHPALAADLFAEQPRLVVRTFNPRKPHQGVTSKNPALHLGQRGWKSKHALGLRGVESRTRVRSRCTGKERDTETGNDYFGARYYSATMSRFMTPDWAARPTTVPYAVFGDPQSLNLYGYVRNDPISRVDVDGHKCDECRKILEDMSHGTSAEDAMNTQQQTTQQQQPAEKKSNTPSANVGMVKYGPIKTPLGSGLVIELKANVSNSSSFTEVNWVQTITETENGKSKTYVDGGGLYVTDKTKNASWYQAELKKQGADTVFLDTPRRLPQESTIKWHSDLKLVGVNKDGSYSTLKTMSYGFSLAPDGTVKPEQLKGVE